MNSIPPLLTTAKPVARCDSIMRIARHRSATCHRMPMPNQINIAPKTRFHYDTVVLPRLPREWPIAQSAS
jgi:hypothetical protein